MMDERIALPEDAASHPLSNVEWWYCYAFLTGGHGSRYAMMASFFRVGELPVLKGHYLIHSFIRLDERKFESRSYVDRTLALQMAGMYFPLYLAVQPADWNTWSQYKTLLKGSIPSPHRLMAHASVRSHPTRLEYGDAELSFPDQARMDFDLRINGILDKQTRISLSFTPAKPASLIDDLGKLNGLQYYSTTRNQIVGELSAPGKTESLTGEGWFDHQWGRNYGLLLGTGWDWFGLQLADGRDLLINRLRRSDSDSPDSVMAKLIGKEGTITTTTEEVEIKPASYWKSLYTGVEYPVEWHISIADFSMELHIKPLLNHQEMPIIGPLRAIWEGACVCTGVSISPQGIRTPIEGKGFVELVGYAR